VTAACLAVPAALFRQVGGFDGHRFAVAFNDVDLCLKIREDGHEIVWTPEPWAYHLESASRGADDLPHKRARMAREEAHLRARVRAWQGAATPFVGTGPATGPVTGPAAEPAVGPATGPDGGSAG
jgi:GT2 family glycosyltransferase